jgi:glutathione S-transferase
MRILHHHPLSAASRMIRVQLGEKGLDFAVEAERPWERRPGFLALNPAAEVPILVEPDGAVVVGAPAIAEFIEETHPEPPLIGRAVAERAEVRRLVDWFSAKFAREVTANLVEEKLFKRLSGLGGPDSNALRAGRTNIRLHLDYIAWLTVRRRWLGGDDFSLADIAAAAHLSAVDYLGDVPWEDQADAKDWYARVKSRPSFRPLLADLLPGTPPPPHYADLDF